jgi:Uma2 family endonuclease
MSTQAVTTTRKKKDQLVQRRRAGTIAGNDTLRRQLLEVLLTSTERPQMTYEEFLAWADEDILAEWVDGEVVMYTPASKRHQDISGFLFEVLRTYVRSRHLGEVIQAPFQMKLEQGREPDLLFVANEHLGRLKETYLDGPADLAVEVVSSESEGRDRGEKFYEYERGGVSEYWLIDPQARRTEFYQLEEGRYRVAFSGREGKYDALVLPNFWLQVEWLWQDPLPHPLRALGEIAGVDPQMIERLLQVLGGEGSPYVG